MTEKICFVINMRTGKLPRSKLSDEARRVFSNYSCDFLFLSQMDDWEQIYNWNSDPDVKAIVVIGGDGTANASLEHLIGMVTPIAYLPGGTANDFARASGFEQLDFVALKESLEANRIIELDVMRANEKYFLTSGGIGLGSDVSLAINESRQSSRLFRWVFSSFGAHMYGLMALKKVIFDNRDRKFSIRLTTQHGAVDLKTSLLLSCNVGLIGKNLNLSPNSKMNDGKFETFSVGELGSKNSVLSSLISARRGLGLTADTSFIEKKIVIDSLEGADLAFFGDGEILLHAARIELEVIPKALRCIVRVAAPEEY